MSELSIDEQKLFQSRRTEIIGYVIDHPKTSKADVIRYMKGRSSVNTTHAILINLINEDKINVYKKNIQTHLLTINEEDIFIKLYKQLDELYAFVNAARLNLRHLGSLKRFYKSKSSLKYHGIQGFENLFRQLFSIIFQILSLESLKSTKGQEATGLADWRILRDKINLLYFAMTYYKWDHETTNEVVDFCTENIKQYFQVLEKEKNGLVKIMKGEDIEFLNNDLEFGNQLIEIIDKFEKEYSHNYRSHKK